MLEQLVVQSAGAAVGVFIGTLIGLMFRKPKAAEQKGMLTRSPLLTATLAGLLALIAMMGINAVRGI